MTCVTINIPDEQLEKLQQLAQNSGISLEDLLRVSLEEWLNHRHNEFTQAASYVLKKNAELYKRLA